MKPNASTRFLALASLLLPLAGCNSHPSPSLNLAEQTSAVDHPQVNEDQINSDLYYLASDGLQGRGVGTFGLDIAADFIASRFESLGLQPPPGQSSYFQRFDITTAHSVDPSTSLAIADRTCKLDDDFTALSFSAD